MRYVSLLSASMLCVVLSACTASPEAKVKQREEQNAALQESSGYNECMRKVKADEKKVEDCIQAKLTAAGYTDGIDCIANPETGVCTGKERYNTQVFASNDCPKEVTYETTLGEGDCSQMLMDAMSR